MESVDFAFMESGRKKMNKYDVASVLTTYSQQLIRIEDANDTKAIKKQIEKLREDLKDIEKQMFAGRKNWCSLVEVEE